VGSLHQRSCPLQAKRDKRQRTSNKRTTKETIPPERRRGRASARGRLRERPTESSASDPGRGPASFRFPAGLRRAPSRHRERRRGPPATTTTTTPRQRPPPAGPTTSFRASTADSRSSAKAVRSWHRRHRRHARSCASSLRTPRQTTFPARGSPHRPRAPPSRSLGTLASGPRMRAAEACRTALPNRCQRLHPSCRRRIC
jgi:hypothetical protein